MTHSVISLLCLLLALVISCQGVGLSRKTGENIESAGAEVKSEVVKRSIAFDDDVEQDIVALLAKFNQSIGWALLRGMNKLLSEGHSITADGQPSAQTPAAFGSSYIRWGRTSCPDQSELIYEGFAAGQYYSHAGGASNYLCLPNEPEYEEGNHKVSYFNPIYMGEYQTGSGYRAFPAAAYQQDAPCARCYAPGRPAALMLPARMTCPEYWTVEYKGYIMSGHYNDNRANAYECMDEDPEYVAGGQDNDNGALFYFVGSSCTGNFPCPPYIKNTPLHCVVCTK